LTLAPNWYPIKGIGLNRFAANEEPVGFQRFSSRRH
jgi:hypothetical protein